MRQSRQNQEKEQEESRRNGVKPLHPNTIVYHLCFYFVFFVLFSVADWLFYLAYLASFVGVLGLSFFSPYLQPPKSDVSAVDVYSVGKSVLVSGVVRDMHVFKGGGAAFSLVDGNSSLRIYLSPKVGLIYGGRLVDGVNLSVAGVVTQYRGEVELVVEREDCMWLH